MDETSSSRIELAASEWLARRESGDWSDTDRAGLDVWLEDSTAHRVAFLRLESAWTESARLKALGAGRAEAGPPPRGLWAQPPQGSAPPPETDDIVTETSRVEALGELTFTARAPVAPRRHALGAGLAAAAVALCGVLALWGWRTHTAIDTASYTSGVGTLHTVALIDGSHATLSSGSRIEVAMSRDERRIDLRSGEAFFEAAKDRARPFIVNADARRVVAVGTKFSVRRDGVDLRVIVTEGLVRLESAPVPGQPSAPVTLLPAGSTAVATRSGVLVRTGTVADAERALEWRGGYLHFDDTPLAEAAIEFNRYGGSKLVMGDSDTAALRIGGNVRWSNVDGFVRLLEQGFGVRAEQRGEIIVLHSH
ncbi:MAG: FecR domain-containing protein [Lysobacteraceae bacterium]